MRELSDIFLEAGDQAAAGTLDQAAFDRLWREAEQSPEMDFGWGMSFTNIACSNGLTPHWAPTPLATPTSDAPPLPRHPYI